MEHTTTDSKERWTQARMALLAKEKDLTKRHDQLNEERRALPWLRVGKTYWFEAPEGRRTLADLFGPHSQLVVYHFMFAPEADAGCTGCSFWADQFDRAVPHLARRDVAFVAVSLAPVPKLVAYATRLGWTFPWVSVGDGDFNLDFGVSFRSDDVATGRAMYNYAPFTGPGTDRHGVSVFAKDDAGGIYLTYATFARGLDGLNGAYQYLDLVPKGRDEAGLPAPSAWWRRRDEHAR